MEFIFFEKKIYKKYNIGKGNVRLFFVYKFGNLYFRNLMYNG